MSYKKRLVGTEKDQWYSKKTSGMKQVKRANKKHCILSGENTYYSLTNLQFYNTFLLFIYLESANQGVNLLGTCVKTKYG